MGGGGGGGGGSGRGGGGSESGDILLTVKQNYDRLKKEAKSGLTCFAQLNQSSLHKHAVYWALPNLINPVYTNMLCTVFLKQNYDRFKHTAYYALSNRTMTSLQ